MTRQLSRRARNRMDRQRRILDAALTVFARRGYSAATMDDIAAAAGLTKPTLYQYFASKRILFAAMMSAPRERMMMEFDARQDDHVAGLLNFARTYARTVMDRDMLSLARLIIGEAQRFPGVGRAYQASGPDQVRAGLAGYLDRHAKGGRLRIEDPTMAAEDFWGLILSGPRNRALHLPDDLPDEVEVARSVENGLRVFLRAYSCLPDDDLARLADLLEEERHG